jgi:hypothetical protein
MNKFLKLILLLTTVVNSYKIINIQTIIRRPIENTIISFIKIGDFNKLKIRNHTNYLVLRFGNKNYENSNINFYNIIKNNNKPLLIINNKNVNNLKSKYTYLIKNKNEYQMKYEFEYNKNKYKYLLNIIASSIDKYETEWNITAIYFDKLINDKLIIKNWIEHLIYQSSIYNDIYKQYIILYFFLNIK